MNVNRDIFREYDIRGVYGSDIDEALAYHLGRAIGTVFRRKGMNEIVLGMDNRLSSKSLTANVSNGLIDSGCNVTFVGLVSYPIIHFLTTTESFNGGVYITASHNSGEYNGLKVEYSKAEPFFGKDILEFADLVESENYVYGKGSLVEKDLTDKYISNIVDRFKFSKKFKIVLNAGNGCAGKTALEIFHKLNVDVIPINCEPDGNFPRGNPDPEEKEFIDQLTPEAIKDNLTGGFGIDGDGDRFVMVDEKGKDYSADRSLLLFSKYILQEKPGSKIVYDVKCTSLADDVIKQYGGEPEIMRTGRSYFLQKIITGGAIFGVEYSGHTYFGDKYYGYDDGVYAICRVLEILDKRDQTLSEEMSEFPERISSPEIKIPCSDSIKFDVVNKVVDQVKSDKTYSKATYVDGVRANITDTAWFLIRAKNTSPFIGVRLEAESEEELIMAGDRVKDLLLPHGLVFRF